MSFDPSQPPIVFGEALFDCFPDGAEVLGGAPFNVAWHLAAFGAEPVFVSSVGADVLGDRIENAMTARGMTTVGLQRDAGHGTGTVQVSLTGGEPSYDIVADRAYDHIDPSRLPDLAGGALLYHGSLALRSPDSARALERLRERLAAAIFLDVNLRDPWWGESALRRMLDGATWVKLNADELTLLAPAGASSEERAGALLERHGLTRVVVTLGAAGAFSIGSDGAVHRVAPQREITVVDAVGAGDGFASVLILGLLRGWSVPQGLERAQDFASAMVSRRGATVDDPEFYADFAERWGL
jgi:fructokinase